VGLKSIGQNRCPQSDLCVLIAGWISGEDLKVPEALSVRDWRDSLGRALHWTFRISNTRFPIPNPEMRPYKDTIDVELREKLILGIAGAVTAIYRYFAPHRRSTAAELIAKQPAYRNPERKVGRNNPCPCGSGKKYKHCCGKAAV
jgi:SEC-C motif